MVLHRPVELARLIRQLDLKAKIGQGMSSSSRPCITRRALAVKGSLKEDPNKDEEVQR